MKISFRFGKRFGENRLTQEQRVVVERFERGELTAEQAEAALGPGARVRTFRAGLGDTHEDDRPPAPEGDEEARAGEMVERIAREVDEETRR